MRFTTNKLINKIQYEDMSQIFLGLKYVEIIRDTRYFQLFLNLIFFLKGNPGINFIDSNNRTLSKTIKLIEIMAETL
jgi:hypothetical protein